MLIGTILTDGLSPFRRSRMEIRPVGPPPESVVEMDIQPDTAYELTTLADDGRRVAMEAHVDSQVLMRRRAEVDAQLWHLVPVGNGYYRIHSHARGRRWSLSSKPVEQPRLELTSNQPDQFWRVTPSPSEPGYVILTSAAGSDQGRVLTSSPTGRVLVKTFEYGTDQLWKLNAVDAELPPRFNEYTHTSSELRGAEPIGAAEVELVNSHRKELWVLITDTLQPANSMRIRIPPGESQIVTLERDPGGAAVEVYEHHLPGGLVEVEEFITPIPPVPRYDVSVYEVMVQSVAIDRTVPGGRLEEVNFSPRSVGWFELPAGPELRTGPFDVYEIARAMNNPGAARRIDPSLWRAPTSEKPDPVESALHEVLDGTEQE
jgi:hypothetical protein